MGHRYLRTFGVVIAAAALLVLAAPASASARVHTYKMRFGPIAIDGYQVKKDSLYVKNPPVNGYVTGMRAHVVDGRGRDIPVARVMLHHVLFLHRGAHRGDRHDGSCPRLPRERFFGTGEEHQVLSLPPGYGVPMSKTDRWSASWMLMNHKEKRDKAYVEYDVTVETGHALTPVKAYWLDVTNCGGGVYWNEPGGRAAGSTYSKQITWRPPFDGRLVAGGAHLHGGAQSMKLYQRRCGNRLLVESRPLYGMPDDPVYHVLPVLHEPGPIDTSWFMSSQGIPVVKGERIRVSGDYDGELPHVRVMAVMHVYMARAKHVSHACGPAPSDLTNANISVPGRTVAPVITVPLTGIGPDGKAHEIDRPPGRTAVTQGNTLVRVQNYAYSRPNLSIPLGATVTWRFADPIEHDVTLANGPFGFSSAFQHSGTTYKQKFVRPGRYKLFCTLHPVVMHEVVDVRP
jgi:plastocyanin